MTDLLSTRDTSLACITCSNDKRVACIRGFQDSMTSWIGSLINQQNGCLKIVAHQASQSRLRQDQLAQTVARSAPSAASSNRDQAQYLRAQLAHRDASLEHVRSERDTHFAQEEELLAHMHLLSSEAKDWKSRVVNEAEQVLRKESAEAARRTTEVQEAMVKQFQARWRQAEAELRDTCESNSAQETLAASLREGELEHQQLHTANERRLQLEAQAL